MKKKMDKTSINSELADMSPSAAQVAAAWGKYSPDIKTSQLPAPSGPSWRHEPGKGLRNYATVQPSDPWRYAYSSRSQKVDGNRKGEKNENEGGVAIEGAEAEVHIQQRGDRKMEDAEAKAESEVQQQGDWKMEYAPS